MMHEGGQPVQSPRRPRRAGERLCSIAAQGGHAKCRAARRRSAGGANGPWSSMLARSIGAAVKCPMRRVDGKAARLLRISPSACRSAPPAPAPPASSTCGRRPRVASALSSRSRAAPGRENRPGVGRAGFLARSPADRLAPGAEDMDRQSGQSQPHPRRVEDLADPVEQLLRRQHRLAGQVVETTMGRRSGSPRARFAAHRGQAEELSSRGPPGP